MPGSDWLIDLEQGRKSNGAKCYFLIAMDASSRKIKVSIEISEVTAESVARALREVLRMGRPRKCYLPPSRVFVTKEIGAIASRDCIELRYLSNSHKGMLELERRKWTGRAWAFLVAVEPSQSHRVN